MEVNNIKDTVISWNIRFPSDRVWRKKYSIPFNSPTHKESNFLDQLFDLEEDKLFEELYKGIDYTPNSGDWLKSNSLSLEDEIESYRNEYKDLDEEDAG